MQDSLPAGGLRLYREGVEPSGSLRKVSGYVSILLSRTSPVARAISANENTASGPGIMKPYQKGRWAVFWRLFSSGGATVAARLHGCMQAWRVSCMARNIVNLDKLAEAQETVDAVQEAAALAAEKVAEAVRYGKQPIAD